MTRLTRGNWLRTLVSQTDTIHVVSVEQVRQAMDRAVPSDIPEHHFDQKAVHGAPTMGQTSLYFVASMIVDKWSAKLNTNTTWSRTTPASSGTAAAAIRVPSG